jgi:IclR family pca regulon transcriptional regulator
MPAAEELQKTRRNHREYIQSLERGFAVIQAFSQNRPSLTIAKVAQLTGLTRAAARRYLFTLRQLGCVRHEEGRFMLTPRVLSLGFPYLSSLTVPAVAEPFMEEIVAELHESCSISVLDGHDIVYVARVPAKRIMSINLAVGSRLPAHATSMGKILLAHLPPHDLDSFFEHAPLQRFTERTICDHAVLREHLTRVRQRGWALANEEMERGIRSVAVPIWDKAGEVTSAINVSAHASRVSLKELRRRYLSILLGAAQAISRMLPVT